MPSCVDGCGWLCTRFFVLRLHAPVSHTLVLSRLLNYFRLPRNWRYSKTGETCRTSTIIFSAASAVTHPICLSVCVNKYTHSYHIYYERIAAHALRYLRPSAREKSLLKVLVAEFLTSDELKKVIRHNIYGYTFIQLIHICTNEYSTT